MGGKVKDTAKSIVKSPVKFAKNITSKEFLTSPGRWAMAVSTYGLSEATNIGKWYSKQDWSTYTDIATAAAIAAATAGSLAGPAAAGTAGGAAGAGAGAGATGAGAAAAGGGISMGTAAMLGATAMGSVKQYQSSQESAKEQRAAQARAEANALAAERESEIMRKQALLSSQKSMTARRATAGAIVNKLKNTTGYLGEDEEKLGG